jgi:hypothetical protein
MQNRAAEKILDRFDYARNDGGDYSLLAVLGTKREGVLRSQNILD